MCVRVLGRGRRPLRPAVPRPPEGGAPAAERLDPTRARVLAERAQGAGRSDAPDARGGAGRRPTSCASATSRGSPSGPRTSSRITCARCARRAGRRSRRDGKMVMYAADRARARAARRRARGRGGRRVSARRSSCRPLPAAPRAARVDEATYRAAGRRARQAVVAEPRVDDGRGRRRDRGRASSPSSIALDRLRPRLRDRGLRERRSSSGASPATRMFSDARRAARAEARRDPVLPARARTSRFESRARADRRRAPRRRAGSGIGLASRRDR